jgi:GDPmannose 4,6-dehydratase
MFGKTSPPQNEHTAFSPTSPYAVAKVYAYWVTKNYRQSYGLFACNGILFNHESPRRGETFVTRKTTMGISNIIAKKQQFLYLGNLEPMRDWGYAPEYVEVMWQILQQEKPEDFVVGTGEQHSVREFVEQAFSYVDLDWEKYVKIDQKYFRPVEADNLAADSKKVKKAIGWKPKTRFKDLVKIMVDADMRKAGLKPIGEGDEILRKKFRNKWWKTD